MNKLCTRCQITKPITDFNKNKSHVDGTQTRCRSCEHECYLDTKIVNTKPCTKCQIIKPLSEFYKNKNKRHGCDSHCKICKKQYQIRHDLPVIPNVIERSDYAILTGSISTFNDCFMALVIK